jgi:hypothetical protein
MQEVLWCCPNCSLTKISSSHKGKEMPWRLDIGAWFNPCGTSKYILDHGEFIKSFQMSDEFLKSSSLYKELKSCVVNSKLFEL